MTLVLVLCATYAALVAWSLVTAYLECARWERADTEYRARRRQEVTEYLRSERVGE